MFCTESEVEIMQSARFDSDFEQYYSNQVAAHAPVSERSLFIQRTYLHLAMTVALYAAMEFVLLNMIGAQAQTAILRTMFAASWTWLLVIGAFMAISWFSQSLAAQENSRGLQYAGLVMFAALEAIITFPILLYANRAQPGVLPIAGLLTLVVFGGLTAFAFVSKQDFSFLGRYLALAMLIALGVVVCGIIFGFSQGIWFSAVMIAILAGYILYDTSNVMYHYRTTQHVAASLALFSSVVTLFVYIVRFLLEMQSRRND